MVFFERHRLSEIHARGFERENFVYKAKVLNTTSISLMEKSSCMCPCVLVSQFLLNLYHLSALHGQPTAITEKQNCRVRKDL